jgi:putative tricarboxylic transport membrane protein
MPPQLRQVLPHGVMLVGAVLLYWAATRIDADTGGRIGPAVWPKTIIVIMGLLCAYEVVKRLLWPAAGEVKAVVIPGAEEGGEKVVREHPRKLYGGIAIIAAYVVAVPWLGFFVTTALFLAAFPWVAGLRRPLLATVLGVGGSLLLVVVFMRVAYISLPFGEGPFRALSLALLRAIGF